LPPALLTRPRCVLLLLCCASCLRVCSAKAQAKARRAPRAEAEAAAAAAAGAALAQLPDDVVAVLAERERCVPRQRCVRGSAVRL
jgi:hypothetical protein